MPKPIFTRYPMALSCAKGNFFRVYYPSVPQRFGVWSDRAHSPNRSPWAQTSPPGKSELSAIGLRLTVPLMALKINSVSQPPSELGSRPQKRRSPSSWIALQRNGLRRANLQELGSASTTLLHCCQKDFSWKLTRRARHHLEPPMTALVTSIGLQPRSLTATTPPLVKKHCACELLDVSSSTPLKKAQQA